MVILTSCGIINDEQRNKFYKIISEEELASKKVLYVTTAVDGEESDDKHWMNLEYLTILALGIKEENITEYKIGEEIDYREFDIMYMMGGNTFYLLDMIRKHNFDKVIEDFAKEKIYIGSSAGSIILGNSIEVASSFDLNNVNMEDFTGLKLINGLIIPHAGRKEEFITNLRNNTNEELIIIYDGDDKYYEL
ncbi:MAG: Type 1 glutamine amidotransferase-like domain-containing protein [Bacilli bacterium]|nr:Type 1 glutamine amidotransferase-like domain-containing protein [Bacilli bacterium]